MTVSPSPVRGRAAAPTDEVTIRAATSRDGAVLTAIVRGSAAYSGRYRVMVADQTIDDRYLLAHPVRVAVAGPEVVGFASLIVPGRGRDDEGELDFLFVADRYQRRGVGRVLFDDLRQVAAQLRLRRIHIVSHPPAEGFYRAQGAQWAGEVPPTGRVTWWRPYLVLAVETAAGR